MDKEVGVRVHCIFLIIQRAQLALFTVMIASAGCTMLPAYTPPLDALVIDDGERRCQEIQYPDRELISMRALLGVTLRRGDEIASFRYAIISRQPDGFRVDILPDTGAFTLGMLVSAGGTTTILDAQDKSFVRGKDEQRLIENFLHIPGFSREVVLGVVSGILPRLSCADVVVRARPGGQLLLEDEHRAIVWHYDSLTRTVQGVTGTTKELAQVRYEIRRTGEDVNDTVISMSVHDPVEASVTMEVRKLSINGAVGDELFRVPIPGGYRENS